MQPASPTFFRAALLVGLLLLPVQLVTAQERVRKARTVDAFTEVEYAIPGTLHLRQGEARSVEIEASKRVQGKLETTVEAGVLKIRAEGESGLFDWFFDDSDLKADEIDVYVTAPTTKRLSVAGAGQVVGETPIKQASLSLNVAGSGDMDLDVDTDELSVRVAGSGTCTLRGRASSIDVNIAGSGNLRAVEVEAQRAKMQIAGSGDARLHVTDHLSAEIFGSGDVRYRGRPTVETNMVGSGEVRPIE